jgi:hypothetical protein
MSSTRKVYLNPDEQARAAKAASDAINKGKTHHGVVAAVLDAINAQRKDFDEPW